MVALLGGYSQVRRAMNDCRNHAPKVIASFSRALTDGLRHYLFDEEFKKILESFVASIVQSSLLYYEYTSIFGRRLALRRKLIRVLG